jgi:hypothetical protein
MFSRLIVAYEVWEEERAEHAEYLIRKATLSQGIAGTPLVLHSDNGKPDESGNLPSNTRKNLEYKVCLRLKRVGQKFTCFRKSLSPTPVQTLQHIVGANPSCIQ